MKVLHILTLSFLLVNQGLQIQAQNKSLGSIKGIVIDSKTKQPLIGASIVVNETGQGTVTDTSGIFLINSILPGKYMLQISYLGYLNSILSDQSVLDGKTIFITIEMVEDGRTLNDVEIKNFRYENNRTKPISTFSFSRDEISLNPGAQGDIFRAIGMLPGVSSSGGVYSAIAVRGQGVRDNVYLVDDIPLTEVGHLEGNSFFNDPNGGRFSIFAPRVIDNAVFQGGAFGAEYGRRSASFLGLGIKEGNKESAIFDGQVDLLGLTLNYDGPSGIKKTTLFISARYQNFSPLFKLLSLQNLGLPAYGDYILKATTEINKRNKLNTLFMVCPESFVRDMNDLYKDKELNLLYLPNFKRNKIIAGLNLRTILGKKTIWKNIAYFTNYASKVEVGKSYPTIDFNGVVLSQTFNFINPIQTQTYRENKWGIRSILEVTTHKSNRLILGIEADIVHLLNNRRLLVNDTNFVFRRSQLFNPLVNYQVITPDLINANYNQVAPNASFFGSYFFDLGTRFSAQIGLRYDYNGFANQSAIAPRVNISYHVNTNQSISLGYGLYYQDPIYSEISDLPNNNKLKMEEVSHLILAYKAYLKRDLKIMIEAWYKNFDNMVVTPISGSILRNNNGTGYGRGIDVSVTKRLSKSWHGIASYSYMNVKRNDNDGLGLYNFTFSQPHQISTMLSYKLNKHWSFSGKYRYATGRPKDAFIIHANVLNDLNNYMYGMELVGRNQARLPHFSSLDLRVNYGFSYKKIAFTTFFDVVNVLNRQIANSESFNYLYGITYYDGLAIFPTGGLKFEF